MAFEENIYSASFAADASLAKYTGVPGQPGSAVPNSGFQYRFVKVTGKAQVGLATDSGDRLIGVMQSKPQVVGQAATIGIWGISLVVSGGVVSAGDEITTDAQGQAIKSLDPATSRGVAITSSSIAGELISVLLQF
jgi:hypothetical protein